MIDVKYLALLLAQKKCSMELIIIIIIPLVIIIILLSSLLNVSDSSLSYESYWHIFYPILSEKSYANPQF